MRPLACRGRGQELRASRRVNTWQCQTPNHHRSECQRASSTSHRPLVRIDRGPHRQARPQDPPQRPPRPLISCEYRYLAAIFNNESIWSNREMAYGDGRLDAFGGLWMIPSIGTLILLSHLQPDTLAQHDHFQEKPTHHLRESLQGCIISVYLATPTIMTFSHSQ